MRKQTKATGLPLFLVTSACLALVACRPEEPTYKGKDLSYWIDVNRNLDWGGHSYAQQEPPALNEAHVAIRTIGTNGLPYLTQWIRYRRPFWAIHFKPRVLRFLRRKVERFNQERADRAQASWQALEVLGTNAVSAIPQLAVLAMKTNVVDRDMAWRATSTLFCLGPQAYPALLNVWSNVPPAEKSSMRYGRFRDLLTKTPAQ